MSETIVCPDCAALLRPADRARHREWHVRLSESAVLGIAPERLRVAYPITPAPDEESDIT